MNTCFQAAGKYLDVLDKFKFNSVKNKKHKKKKRKMMKFSSGGPFKKILTTKVIGAPLWDFARSHESFYKVFFRENS